jgi:hypothetical protein
VADIPLDTLLAGDRELARRWVGATILERPLEELGELPLGELSALAPALCAQVLRALSSEAELARLLAGEGDAAAGRGGLSGAASLVTLLGAGDASGAAVRAEALRGVLWEGLLDALSLPGPRLLGDLSDRLAYVCSMTLSAALAAAAAPGARARPDPGSPSVSHELPGGAEREDPRTLDGLRPALLVDEFEPASRPGARAPAFERASGALASERPSAARPERPFVVSGDQVHGGRRERSRGPAPERPFAVPERGPVDPPLSSDSPREASGGPVKPRPLPWDTPA